MPSNKPQIPNLDTMDDDALREFWITYDRAVPTRARQLVPDRRAGYVGVVRKLALYALNLHTARHCRTSGKIEEAQRYEAICQRLYSELPPWAKW